MSGRAMVGGMVVGAVSVLTLGMGQPANQQADEVLARLDRIERALLKPESVLPVDPEKSIEGMLEEVLAQVTQIQAVLAAFDQAELEGIARQVRVIHDSLIGVKVADIRELNQRLDDIERQFVRLGPTGRLEDLIRLVDDLKREVDVEVTRELGDNQRQIDGVARSVQSLESQVRRLESRIK